MISDSEQNILDCHDICPTDPERCLSPYEHNLVMRRSVVHLYCLFTETPDLKRLEGAYRRLLESFPCLISEVELASNGRFKFKPQPITVPDFEQLYADAGLISTDEELTAIALEINKKTKIQDSIALKPSFLKIRVEESKACPMFRGKYTLILCFECNHVLVDGTSMGKVPCYINMLYNDPKLGLLLKEPQRVPMYVNFLIQDKYILDKSMKGTFGPGNEHTGYLNSSYLDPPKVEDKSVLFTKRYVPPGVIRKFPIGCRLTSCFLALHSFIIISLLFHQQHESDSLSCTFGQLRLINFSWLKNPFPDPLSDLFGVRISTISTTFNADRETHSVYSSARAVEESIEKANNPEFEAIVAKCFLGMKWMDESDLKEVPPGRHRVSNIGMIPLPDGPIKTAYAIGTGGDEFGTLHLCPWGTPDGSMVLFLDCDGKCFTKEFSEYFLDVYVMLWEKLVEGDVHLGEFMRSPEYAKLAELLDVKKPSLME